jgi:hypothetical protein
MDRLRSAEWINKQRFDFEEQLNGKRASRGGNGELP